MADKCFIFFLNFNYNFSFLHAAFLRRRALSLLSSGRSEEVEQTQQQRQTAATERPQGEHVHAGTRTEKANFVSCIHVTIVTPCLCSVITQLRP